MCGLQDIFQLLFFGRLTDASILFLSICLLCSMLIERVIDRTLLYQTDVYHIYLPHRKHVCMSLIAAPVNTSR